MKLMVIVYEEGFELQVIPSLRGRFLRNPIEGNLTLGRLNNIQVIISTVRWHGGGVIDW